ncbi:uncharacterized protein LOC118256294 [Cygnus atratus]|uniref:uncharacterized protein LOC118256294 n=1 Tax=Cygnus atratus TaxID=8868 RepID=UPI0021B7E146|nr:uncharacterized protein LOC118256294 [Cygnus atratus]
MLACLSKNVILTANFSKLMKALWSPKAGKDMVKHKETAPDEEKETPQNSDKNFQNIREGQNVGQNSRSLGRRGPAPAASPGLPEEEEEEEEEEEPWTPPLALAALRAGRPGDSAQGGRANRTEAPADFFARKPAFRAAEPPGPPGPSNPSSPSHRGSRSCAPPRLQPCSAANPRSPPRPPARLGTARHGPARLGTAQHSSARLGTHLLRGASRVEARARRLPRRGRRDHVQKYGRKKKKGGEDAGGGEGHLHATDTKRGPAQCCGTQYAKNGMKNLEINHTGIRRSGSGTRGSCRQKSLSVFHHHSRVEENPDFTNLK